MNQQQNLDNYQWNAYGLAIFAAALRMFFIQSNLLDLIPDEAYYWTWSERLSIGYHTKGPVTAWVIRIFTEISGDTPFAVRIGAVLFALIGTVFTYKLTVALFRSTKAGFFVTVFITVAPLFAVGGVVMTPDTLLFCFWVMALFFLAEALEGKRPRPWYLLGLIMGLGILSKYLMLVFPVLMFGFLASAPDQRHWLKRSGPYIALSMALLAALPLMMWNASHDWLVISHLTGRGGLTRPGWTLDLDKIGENLAGQLVVIGPFLLALCLVPFVKLNRWFQETRQSALLLLSWFSIPILGFYGLLGLFKKVEPNWTAVAFIPLLILAGVWWSHDSRASKGQRGMVWGSVIVTAILVIIMHVPSLLLYFGYRLPVTMDPTMRFQGWKTLAWHVGEYLEEYPEDSVFILAENQHIASETAFYLNNLDLTYVQPYRQRNTQFIFWPGPNSRIGYDALYIALNDAVIPDELRHAFAFVDEPTLVRVLHAGELIRRFSIYHCADFKGLP